MPVKKVHDAVVVTQVEPVVVREPSRVGSRSRAPRSSGVLLILNALGELS